jgi:oligogalacturonide transport system permease protein
MSTWLNRPKAGRKIRDYTGLLYISPWIIGCLAFQLYPFIASFVYSFTDFSLIKEPHFVGLRNYITLFTSSEVLKSATVTLTYVVIAVPLKIIFALLVAMLLNVKLKHINFYRTAYYLPSILGGSVAIAVLWRFLFMRDGVINNILSLVSIQPVDWLGEPQIALFTISILTVWQFGSSMVLFLAALKQVPESLYEAARMDGASRVRTFFVITLPMISPIVFFNMVMQMVGAFQEFTGAFVITHGGPMKATYLYGLLLYEQGFRFFKMGYASALSWVEFMVIMIFTLLVFKSSSAWVYYEDGEE